MKLWKTKLSDFSWGPFRCWYDGRESKEGTFNGYSELGTNSPKSKKCRLLWYLQFANRIQDTVYTLILIYAGKCSGPNPVERESPESIHDENLGLMKAIFCLNHQSALSVFAHFSWHAKPCRQLRSFRSLCTL